MGKKDNDMNEIDFISMNRKRYAEIIGCIKELTSRMFFYLNLSDDIANTLLVKLMKSSAFTDPSELSPDFIKSAFPKAVEDVFNYYQKVSFQYCLTKTHDHHLSEDTSQEAIRQLLSSKHHINDVHSWLRQVTHNLLCKHYEFRAKEKDLYNTLCMETTFFHNVMASGYSIDIEGLNPRIKKEILASQEYHDYEAMLSFDSIKDYASSKNVSEKVAQKRKERAIRNLRSKILLAMGWQASREILNYNQYNAILKFIRELLAISRGDMDVKQRSKLYPKLVQVMNGIESIDDWGITMVGNRRFRLHIFHLSQSKQPIIATFFIVLNERNHVSVENCKKNEIIGAHPIPANIQIPKEMGKALWPYEKIISLLNI
jgi:DNA-directed RNA polymerase specialized sigma24 family protein